MNCWHCGTQLIWGGDFDGEDYGVQEEYSIVTNLSCPNCKSYVEVYYPKQMMNSTKKFLVLRYRKDH